MSESGASYDHALVSDLDRMRDALDDINTSAPFAPDVTYMAYLDSSGNDWRRATASMARKFASRAINSPSSFNIPGDISVSWHDRAAAWLKIAMFYEEESDRLNPSRDGFWQADVSRTDIETDTAEFSIELKRR